MKTPTRTFSAIFSVLAASSACAGTLLDVYNQAIVNNPSLQKAEALTDEAQAAYANSWLSITPRVNLTLDYESVSQELISTENQRLTSARLNLTTSCAHYQLCSQLLMVSCSLLFSKVTIYSIDKTQSTKFQSRT